MKTLIVYYSLTQNNETLVKLLRTKLDCEALKIESVRRRTAFSIVLDNLFSRKPAIHEYNETINHYDQLVLAGPIWLGKLATPLKTFLTKEKNNIKHYSLISVCGGLPGQAEKIELELTSIVGLRPDRVCELWVSTVAEEKIKRDPKNMSAYRIGSSDLQKFRPKIDEFCESLQREIAAVR